MIVVHTLIPSDRPMMPTTRPGDSMTFKKRRCIMAAGDLKENINIVRNHEIQ